MVLPGSAASFKNATITLAKKKKTWTFHQTMMKNSEAVRFSSITEEFKEMF